MTQSERRELKRVVTMEMENVEIAGLEFVGFTVKGALFLEKEKDTYVEIQAVVKSDTFDSDFEMEEYETKEKARIERENKKKEKAKEKEGA